MGPGVVMGEGDRMVVMVMSVRMNIFLLAIKVQIVRIEYIPRRKECYCAKLTQQYS
jgi:hypothetical protein